MQTGETAGQREAVLPAMKPQPVNPQVDAVKSAILALTDADRLHVLKWANAWIEPDGTMRFVAGRYPPPMTWLKDHRP